MLNVALCCVFLLGCASCNQTDLNIPDGETCFSSAETFGKLLCENTIYAENSPNRSYDRFVGQTRDGKSSADVVTNSDDYFKFRQDYIETKKKYLICKKYPSKCQ